MKKRKIIISVLLVFFIAATGVGYYYVHSQKISAAISSQEIVLEEGQELLYAKITSISGNEMEYTVLEAQMVDLEEMGNDRGRNRSEQNAGDRQDDGKMPSEGEPSFRGGMPSGDEAAFGGGRLRGNEIPSGGGEQLDTGQISNNGMPQGNQNGKSEDNAMQSNHQNGNALDENSPEDMQDRTMTVYTEIGKTGQIQIPVGTDVETKLGTITTFSRLSNGDTIRMLMQKADNGGEDLLKIWIVE